MTNILNNYLIRALVYGYSPRVLTFIFTAITFPFVVHKMGGTEYGIVAIVSAFVGVFQILGDLGISAAVGKAVAEVRIGGASYVRKILPKWISLQIVSALLGLIPTVIVGIIFIRFQKNVQIPTSILLVCSLSAMFGIFSSFTRSIHRSLFEFKKLAVMDTFESLSRSAGYFVVAIKYPDALSFTIAELLSICIGLLVGLYYLRISLRSEAKDQIVSAAINESMLSMNINVKIKDILRESLNFFLIRVTTNGMSQFPILIVGKIQGPESSAVIAALFRLVDIFNGPVVILGQIIGIKAIEIMQKGEEAIRFFGNQIWRICASWLPVSIVYFVLSEKIAEHMLGDSRRTKTCFMIFTLFMMANVIGSIFSVIIDYSGKAHKRFQVMMPIAILEVALVIAGSYWFGLVGSIVAIIISYGILVVFYVYMVNVELQKAAFVPKDAKIFITFNFIGLIFSWLINNLLVMLGVYNTLFLIMINITTLAIIISISMVFIPIVKKHFNIESLLVIE